MRTYSKDEFYARVDDELSEEYASMPNADTLTFVPQYVIPHTKASGVALRIGTIPVGEKSEIVENLVLALILFDKGVVFCKAAGTHLSTRQLNKHVRLEETMRQLGENTGDGGASALRSHIWAWVMEMGALGEFKESSVVNFKSFKAGCKILASMRQPKGHDDTVTSEELSEVKEDNEDTSMGPIVGVKRRYDDQGKEGMIHLHRTSLILKHRR